MLRCTLSTVRIPLPSSEAAKEEMRKGSQEVTERGAVTKTVPGRAAREEWRVEVAVLPLKLNADQDTLEFLVYAAPLELFVFIYT